MMYNALRKGRVSEAGREYLVTAVTFRRERLFERLDIARMTVQTLRELDERGMLRSLAWVLMPDHLHWLVVLGEGVALSTAMQHFKGRSAKRINEHLQREAPVWQPSFHDRALRDDEDRVATARYIIANPLRAGLAMHVGDYPHWDAVWLDTDNP